ncbi:2-amino-4-hydroxy-6-hydroxymethyldihydropteridine pyrophosphokinase [Catenovulum agarivorans DS-2]|uniref:2-amino-4-hydroxy-6-hydroxymethyldihydropteridine pyrophosphokinase n=1 Tax=Catenovulum agarivorans DS-2 TaxID=1328313 RepID=W7QQZ5_9ALTE|nr:2-amino-4-hydroxy-6-hydroxymethyldihydropteridine diphosphokinase [Catenovulum agarivorans]EWH10293.1 2-amino-4-hydroxy-6-hydroxymethyldihydropteridine pyrophosphokinase [Catenovulum agarivorans DS-2]
MTKVYIGLGSNLANPQQQITDALNALADLPNVSSLQVSSLYASKPMGPQDQPDYVNAVASFSWVGEALVLLDELQRIEQLHGRVRKAERWGPRTLDLDIILYGEQTIESERLVVPHYGMHQRSFVLYPLAELSPELILPCGTPLTQLLNTVPAGDLSIIN